MHLNYFCMYNQMQTFSPVPIWICRLVLYFCLWLSRRSNLPLLLRYQTLDIVAFKKLLARLTFKAQKLKMILCEWNYVSTMTSLVCRFGFRMKCIAADGLLISNNIFSLTVTFMTTYNPVSHQFKLMMNKTLFHTKNIHNRTTHITETKIYQDSQVT